MHARLFILRTFHNCVLFKTEKRKYNFSNNQLLSWPAEYNVLLLCYNNLYTSTVNDNALPV